MRVVALRDPVTLWLWGVWAMVLAMVGIGGITRLTGSGLSMVEWHPLMGALPPLSEAEWLAVFEQYRASPQYQQVNHWMQLADFQRIFFWEYVHRLFGRLIGLAFAVPFAVFVVRRQLRGTEAVRVGLALLLGGAQGLLGWYMVKSGLVNEPRVSHFRLAAHLSLAFAVGAYLAFLALDRAAALGHTGPAGPVGSALNRRWGLGVLALVGLQVVFGAFMAGTRAGLLYDTFPDMGGHYGPAPFFRFDGVVENLLHSPAAIHWTHRGLAWALLLLGGGWALSVLRGAGGQSVLSARLVLLALLLQFGLGALTVVYGVAIPLAVSHQLGGYLLLTSVAALCHQLAGRGTSPDVTHRVVESTTKPGTQGWARHPG